MTSAISLAYPPGRVLAGWWKQLAQRTPGSIWVGYLLLHRIEALVSIASDSPLDSLAWFLLRALGKGDLISLDEIDNQIHLGAGVSRQLLRQLEHQQLVRQAEPDRWALTPAGIHSAQTGKITRALAERRCFYLVHPANNDLPAQFVPLQDSPAISPLQPSEDWRFDPAWLISCFDQSADWKQQRHFPTDVRSVLSLEAVSEADGARAWQHVPFDRPEKICVILTKMPTGTKLARLTAYAVLTDNWSLQMTAPAFVIEGDSDVFSMGWGVEPSSEDWRRAWKTWAQPRSLPAAEIDACQLRLADHRLQVSAPGSLIEKLRAARSDVFRGEAWLLAGTGQFRQAARIDLASHH